MIKSKFELSEQIASRIEKILGNLEHIDRLMILLAFTGDMFEQIKNNRTASQFEEYHNAFIDLLFDDEIKKELGEIKKERKAEWI